MSDRELRRQRAPEQRNSHSGEVRHDEAQRQDVDQFVPESLCSSPLLLPQIYGALRRLRDLPQAIAQLKVRERPHDPRLGFDVEHLWRHAARH